MNSTLPAPIVPMTAAELNSSMDSLNTNETLRAILAKIEADGRECPTQAECNQMLDILFTR
jgi:hypothetical protein